MRTSWCNSNPHTTPQHPKPQQLSFLVYLPGTSNDMLPTPSPVSYRRVKQEEEMSWKAAKQTPVWPQHTGWFGMAWDDGEVATQQLYDMSILISFI